MKQECRMQIYVHKVALELANERTKRENFIFFTKNKIALDEQLSEKISRVVVFIPNGNVNEL
jgi:hypothetical protein